MGLDNRIEERDRQLVDKDVETGEWGLVDQIENSARGHIPDDDQLLLQRMEDEQVRRALDRGCDRDSVMDVLGMSQRSTFYKVKRAYAFDFPLDAFSRGGRPAADSQEQDASEADCEEADPQQRLDAVTDDDGDTMGRSETWGGDSAADSGDAEAATLLSELTEDEAISESEDDFHSEVAGAIETLEEVQAKLE